MIFCEIEEDAKLKKGINMKNTIVILLITLSSGLAFATGGHYCTFTSDDGSNTFEISADTSRMKFSPVISLSANVTFPKQSNPITLESHEFEKSEMFQYWSDEKGLGMKLYYEPTDTDIPCQEGLT